MENQNSNEVTERIREIIKYAGMNSVTFAAAIEIQSSTITHILLGRNTATVFVIQKILTVFPEINVEYLIMGNGELLKQKNNYF